MTDPLFCHSQPPAAGLSASTIALAQVHASYYDEPWEIERYQAAFADIREAALDEQASTELIARLAEEFDRA